MEEKKYPKSVDLNELKRRIMLYDLKSKERKDLSLPKRGKCPKCDGTMEDISISKSPIEKCKDCKGIWLDHGELEELIKLDYNTLLKIEKEEPVNTKEKLSDKIYYFDKNRKWLDCPRCRKRLRETYFRGDESIWIEICDQCRGSFYDYQELTKIIKLLKNNNK